MPREQLSKKSLVLNFTLTFSLTTLLTYFCIGTINVLLLILSIAIAFVSAILLTLQAEGKSLQE